ncbi:MAG: hypothetical protein HRT61_08585 [Ekhidna sp.]|nr:hypothetical protein [Ekhidna sp.]
MKTGKTKYLIPLIAFLLLNCRTSSSDVVAPQEEQFITINFAQQVPNVSISNRSFERGRLTDEYGFLTFTVQSTIDGYIKYGIFEPDFVRDSPLDTFSIQLPFVDGGGLDYNFSVRYYKRGSGGGFLLLRTVCSLDLQVFQSKMNWLTMMFIQLVRL